jgi:medium-chain acyl-[acyl-carrier-protein] hydrolase
MRLYAFPFAGGGASVFFPWAKYLTAEIELWAVRLPGRETRLREAPIADFGTMRRILLEELTPQFTPPFGLIGHSLGAILAYTVARDLQQAGHATPEALVVAGARPPARQIPRPLLSEMGDSEFVRSLAERYNSLPPSVIQNPELLALVLPTLRADIGVYESFQYEGEPGIKCRTAAFGGKNDPLVSGGDLADWRGFCTGEFSHQLFPGDHFFLQSSVDQVVRAAERVMISL